MQRSAAQAWYLAFAVCLISCSETPNDHTVDYEQEKDTVALTQAEDTADVDTEDTYSMWQDPCVDCEWYFCPPLDSVWQKQICIDSCEDPPTVVYEGQCEEFLECDPSQTLLEKDLVCTTEEGLPGTQDKVCNKGKIQYTECVTLCTEELCNGLDDDCDGLVDEGFDQVLEECNNIDDNCNGVVDEGEWECDEGCGPGPKFCIAGQFICTAPLPQEEVCDGIDNDCDGETDEGQLNACGSCGLLPDEECNGIDDDCNGLIDEGLLAPCSTACGDGYEICDQGNWVSCNAPPVFEEICDGLDNDCDGQIDEGLECVCTIQDVGTLFPCQESPLQCGQGFKTCECEDPECKSIVTTQCYASCYWLASPAGSDPNCDPTGGTPVDEKCNNYDDNCNLLIDENLFATCYTGPDGTVGVGICLPGEEMCKEGKWGNINENSGLFTPGYCKGEVTPQDEICDGVDNDCDGITDYGNELKETDILFVVDWSGSMAEERDAVLIALNQFASTYSDEEVLQWGTILGPRKDPLNPWGDDLLELFHNLSPFSDFLSAMSSLSSAPMSGGSEMLLDAIYLSVKNIALSLPIPIIDLDWFHYSVAESIPPHDQFDIDWRSEAEKIIIVFTDEHPQSYLKTDTGLPLLPDDIMTAVQSTPKLKVYVFSTQTSWEWDEIADATSGKYFDLTDNPTQLYNNLMEILDEVCAGP